MIKMVAVSLLNLALSVSSFAFPKIGSIEAFTTSGTKDGTSFSYVTLTEEVTDVDPETKIMSLKTSWMANDHSMRAGSNKIKTSEIEARYATVSNCTLNGVEVLNADAIANGKTKVIIIDASLDKTDSIFGKIQSCKVTTLESDGRKWSFWMIDRAFGIAKIIVSDQPDLATVLSSYIE